MKLKCKCGKLAVWNYMPGGDDRLCCEDCVPRGCTCNQINSQIEVDGEIFPCLPHDDMIEGKDYKRIDEQWWEDLDGEGRQLPCCEWFYNESGWDDE